MNLSQMHKAGIMSSPVQFDANQISMQIGGLRGQEWIIIAVIVIVLFFGARKLPDLARSFCRATGEYEKGKVEVQKEVEEMKKSWEQGGLGKEKDHEKLIKAAKELGIDTEGKTESELKEEIQKALLR